MNFKGEYRRDGQQLLLLSLTQGGCYRWSYGTCVPLRCETPVMKCCYWNMVVKSQAILDYCKLSVCASGEHTLGIGDKRREAEMNYLLR
jgi:hypothetical protein